MKVFICLLALTTSAYAGFLGGLAGAPLAGAHLGSSGLHTITIQEEAPSVIQHAAAPAVHYQHAPAPAVYQHAAAPAVQYIQAPAAAPGVQVLSAPAPAPAYSVLSAPAPAQAVFPAAAPAPGFQVYEGASAGVVPGAVSAGFNFASGAVNHALGFIPQTANSALQFFQPGASVYAAAPAVKTIQVAQQAPAYKTIQLLQQAPEVKTIVQEALPVEHHQKTIVHGDTINAGHDLKFLQYIK